MDKFAFLDLLAECKREAVSPRERQICDNAAFDAITQEIEPMKMAASLDYWLGRDWLGPRHSAQAMEKLRDLAA